METAFAGNSYIISFEISHRKENLCRKLIRNKWVRFKGGTSTNLVAHNNIYMYVDTYTYVRDRVATHRSIFVCKITWIFTFFLTGNSLSTWHNIVYYNGTALHVNLKGSLLLREWGPWFPSNKRCWKVSQDNPFDQLGTCWGVCSRCEENISP